MAFTNVNTATYWGKTGIPALTTAIDANFALLEAGGAGAVTVDSLVCTAGATFGGGAGATGVTIGTTGTLTIDGITQINDNVAIQFEGVANDLDGMTLAIDNAGDATINVTAGKLTLTTSDGDVTTASTVTSSNVNGFVASGTTLGVSVTGAATDGVKVSGACVDGIEVSGVCSANAINISGANTGHAISVSGTWVTGIAGGAISVGDYSTAIAFGTISDHLLGQVINISAAVDDDSNIIPMHVAFTNTADCGSNSVAQVMYARATLAYAITDCYAVRARVDITDATTPTLNMVTGIFSTLTTKACEIAEAGMIASIIGTVDGTEDITTVGYGKVCGAYIFWNHTNAMTADTCGVHIGVNTSALLDSGYRINTSGTTVNSFHSYNSSGTITTGLNIEGAHANAFSFPAAGTAPVEAGDYDVGGGTVVRISVLVGGQQYYITASTEPTGA